MKTAIVFLFAAMCAGQTPMPTQEQRPAWAYVPENAVSLGGPVFASDLQIVNSGRVAIRFFLRDKEKLVEIYNEKGEITFTVYLDGHIVSAGNQPVDEATKAFWKSFAAAFSDLCKEPKP